MLCLNLIAELQHTKCSSGAPLVRIFGELSNRENLFITSPFERASVCLCRPVGSRGGQKESHDSSGDQREKSNMSHVLREITKHWTVHKGVLPFANFSAISSLLQLWTLVGVEVFLNTKETRNCRRQTQNFILRKLAVRALASVGCFDSWVHVKQAGTWKEERQFPIFFNRNLRKCTILYFVVCNQCTQKLAIF